MLETIEEYNYIRDTILFNEDGEPRATIDTDVLGIREQVRLPRLVDMYYLTEVSATYDNDVLSNSVEFQWPVQLSTHLPTPNLDDYVDPEKLNSLSVDDLADICNYEGGNPDYWEENRKYEEAMTTRNESTEQAKANLDEMKEELEEDFNDQKQEFEDEIKLIEDDMIGYESEYNDRITAAYEEYDEAIQSIEKKIQDVNEQKSSGEITEGVWNNRRCEYEDELHDAYIQYSNLTGEAYMDYDEQLSLHENMIRETNLSIDMARREYQKNLEIAESDYKEELKSIENTFKETSDQIYRESNGDVGSFWQQSNEELSRRLADLAIYPAEKHVDKAIPWVPKGKVDRFIEYNDRLYADWEKCQWRKITNFHLEKNIGGFWEDYTAFVEYDDIETDWGTLPGYSINTRFNRWNSSDDIYYSRAYENPFDDAWEHSEYTFDDNTFSLRLGKRHEQGNIEAVKVLVRVMGDGEGMDYQHDYGFEYALFNCTRDGVQQAGYLAEWDDENDIHLKEVQDIEDEFLEAKRVIDNQYEHDLEDIEDMIESDIYDIRKQAYDEKGNKTAATISSLRSQMDDANRKYENGEDNEQELEAIRKEMEDLSLELLEIDEKLGDDINRRRIAGRDQRSRRREQYVEELQPIQNTRTSKLNAENRRHSDELYAINNAYQDEYEDWIMAALDVMNEMIQAARDDLNETVQEYENEKISKNRELVQKWNDRFAEDFPEYELDKDYDIIGKGYPDGLLSEEEKEWAFRHIRMEGYNFEVSWVQPLENASNACTTAENEAEAEFDFNKKSFEIFDPNARELWHFDATELQSFAEDFEDRQQTEAKSSWGDKSVGGMSVVAVFAYVDNVVRTGVEYPDYEEIDSEEEPEDGDDDDNGYEHE